MTDLRVTIGKITFENPVLVASGTFGYGDECGDIVELNRLGGIVTKSLSLKPRDGNPPPRIAETAGGMLNSIGLANIGVQKFIEEKLPFLRTLQTRIIVNIAASSVDEYCSLVKILDEEGGIDGYEINVSCPNVKEGGLFFGTDCHLTAEITRRLRSLTTRTLIIKLTPNVTHISDFARAVANEGADAVSLINTVVGMAIDIRTKRPKLSTTTGGLSGPAIKPIALAKVFEVSRVVSIPIIGIGGIVNADDAVEFILAGATAVEVGSANFIDPAAGVKIVDGLLSYCSEHNIPDLHRIIGAVEVSKENSILHN
jgi:dihydroorotate dehydrogenase (NAD+) catalytic subunit